MIEVTNLTKRYGNHLAVNHLSFHVDKGQIYGFLGPNGAGKSTTMNMLTGYLAATEGTIVINGHDVLKEPEEAKKSIGYLPEIPPLYTDMTVLEYLHFAAELKKVPKTDRQKQIKEVMEMTMITDMSGRLIKNLSKGYRQRVGLAQAILGYPEVIILDEPTVGLDPKQIIEIRDLIKNLGKEHTIILSSHILSEVSAICDHIMIISHGRLVASDSPEGLQKMMKGNTQLSLTVKGAIDDIKEALSHIEDIDKMDVADSKESDCADVTISVTEGKDVREAVFYALAEKRLPILSMNHSEKSLEDIFLTLTEEEPVEDKDTSEKSETQAAVDSEQKTGVEEDAAKEEKNNDSNL